MEIAEYTLLTWGDEQTIRYPNDLETCCQQQADSPGLGRPCEEIPRGLRRMERDRHAMFYRKEESGILASRILHQRMLPQRRGDELAE